MEVPIQSLFGCEVITTSVLFFMVAFLIKKLTDKRNELVSVVLQTSEKGERNNNVDGKNEKVYQLKKYSSMPGPWGYPLFGSAPRFGKFPHKVLSKWGKEYGPVYKMQIGSRSVVVVTGYDYIKEGLVKQGSAFAGRGDFISNQYICGGLSLSFSTYSPSWKIQKTKARKALNIYTGGHESDKRMLMESAAETEANQLADQFLKLRDIENSTKLIRYASANVICTICFGINFEYNDPVLEHIMHSSDAFDDIMGTMNIVNFSPWMSKVPFLKHYLQNFITYMNDFNIYINDLLGKSWGSYDENHLRHAADCLRYESEHGAHIQDNESDEETFEPTRNEVEKEAEQEEYGAMTNDFAKARESGTKGEWKEGLDENFKGFTMIAKDEKERIFRCIMDIYGAGFETIAAALNWLILYVTLFEDMQEKMADEIREHLEPDETPSLRLHGDKLVYVQGFLHEFLRQSAMFPLPIPHCTTRDTQLAGYHVPKNTMTFFNFWEAHQDKNNWKDPEVFRPERFIKEDPEKGFVLDTKETKKLLTFGIGIRRCLGEQLAKNELFSFLVVLVRRCKFEPYVRNENPKLPWPLKPALTIAPQPYKLKVKKRVYPE